MYVDDFISGATTVPEANKLKDETSQILNDAQFELHKWNSNVEYLETDSDADLEQSFANQQLGQPTCQGESKLPGLPWNKREDTLSVNFPDKSASVTKRGILGNLAQIYDSLGIVSPVTLEGKLIYREPENCMGHPLAYILLSLFQHNAVSHPIKTQEPIERVQIHAFGDASGKGISAAVYAVVTQESGTTQGLITAKSRIAKQGLTIPCLELVAGHMAVNLAANVRESLNGFRLDPDIQCWLDRTVALHWISDRGVYRQFVANRVRKIQSHPNVIWRHVPTRENPADLGSRGGSVTGGDLWWKGPSWLADPEKLPPNIVTQSSPESRAERKVQQELFAGAVEGSNDLDHILEKFGLSKARRVGAWVSRFTHNSRHPSYKI